MRVIYWQWGKRIEHDEEFASVAEAVAFLRQGVPEYANQVRDFAPDAIVDGEYVIDGAELARLLHS